MNTILPIVVSNALFAAALFVIAAIVTRLWRSPQLAHALWALVLLKLMTPPIAVLNIPSAWLNSSITSEVSGSESPPSALNEPEPVAVNELPPQYPEELATRNAFAGLQPEEIAPESEIGSLPAVEPLSRIHALGLVRSHWPYIFGIIWCLGTVTYALALIWRCLQFRSVLSVSTDASPEVRAAASNLGLTLGLPRCPSLRVVDAQIPPLVWSLGIKPVILLPMNLLAVLDTAQRDAVIAHELAHVRRRDDLIRWLEVITLVVFWWNPIAWFARRRLRESEEECCDAWVVWALPEHRRSYGQAMLKTIEFLTDRPVLPVPAGSAFGSPFYKRRIEMIMKNKMNRTMSWSAFAVVTLLAVGVLPVVAQSVTSDEISDQAGAMVESSANPNFKQLPDDIVARVNGEPIAFDRLAEESLFKHGEKDLYGLVVRVLIERACRDKGVFVSADEIDKRIEQTADKFGLSAEAYLRLLKEERGISAQLYQQNVVLPTLALEKLTGTQDQESLAQFAAGLIGSAQVKLNPRFAKQGVQKRFAEAAEDFGELKQKYEAETNNLNKMKLAVPANNEALPTTRQQLQELELEFLRAKVRILESQQSTSRSTRE